MCGLVIYRWSSVILTLGMCMTCTLEPAFTIPSPGICVLNISDNPKHRGVQMPYERTILSDQCVSFNF